MKWVFAILVLTVLVFSVNAQAPNMDTFYPDHTTIPEVGKLTSAACSNSYSGFYRCTVDRAEVSGSIPGSMDDWVVSKCVDGKWDYHIDYPQDTYDECVNECKTDSDFSANCAEPELHVKLGVDTIIAFLNTKTPADQVSQITIKEGSVTNTPLKTCKKAAYCEFTTPVKSQDEIYKVEAALKDGTKIKGDVTKPGTPGALCATKGGRCQSMNINSLLFGAYYSKEDCTGSTLCSIVDNRIGLTNDPINDCESTRRTWCTNGDNGYCAATPKDCLSPFQVKEQIVVSSIGYEVLKVPDSQRLDSKGQYLVLRFTFLDKGNNYAVTDANIFIKYNEEHIKFEHLGCNTAGLGVRCEFGLDMIKIPKGQLDLRYEATIIPNSKV